MPSSYVSPPSVTSAASVATDNYIGNLNDKLLWEEYMGDLYDRYNRYKKAKIFDMLKELKSKRPVSTEVFGHLERDYYILNFRPSANVGAGAAGAIVEFTINASDHKSDTTFPSLHEIYETPTGIFVKVVGKDTGSADGETGGIDAASAAVTPTSMGGAAGAHVIAVKPLIAAESVPAMTATTRYVFRGNSVGESSDQVSGKVTEPIEYQNRTSNIRHDYEVTGNSSTNVVWMDLTLDGSGPNGGPTKVWALNDYYTNGLIFDNKIENACMFVPASDNIPADEATTNGAIPQILADGLTHNYAVATLQFSDFNTICKYLVQNGGVTEYLIAAGYDAFQEIQDLMRDYFKNGAIVYGRGMMTEDIAVNFDFISWKYNGVTFHMYLYDAFNNVQQSGAAGYNYVGDAIIAPLDRMSVWDLEMMRNVPRERIIYRYKATEGQVRDENNHWMTGGAVLAKKSRTSPKDNAVFSWLAEVGLEMIALNGFVYLKRT